MIYMYKCPDCRTQVDSTYRGDALGPCPNCTTGVLKRRWSVNSAPVMQEHFNHTTGTVVGSMAQFRDDLKRASDEYSQRTGIESDFQPREWGELGATGEGMDDVNRERTKLQLPTLTTPGT